MKKNVLLASAALVTLGMTGSVNADEKVVSESAIVASTPEKVAKAATEVPAKAATEVSEKAEDKQAEPVVDETADQAPEFSQAYIEKVNQWVARLTQVSNQLDKLETTNDFNLAAFLKTYYYDMMALQGDIEAYMEANDVSEEAQMLLDGLDAYLSSVAPVMDQLEDLQHKFDNGELTKEQLLAEVQAIMMAAEAEGDTAPKQVDEVKPVEAAPVEQEAVVAPATVETLPETGSDAKSFISAIGAVLAGLTIWGFGFKKRG